MKSLVDQYEISLKTIEAIIQQDYLEIVVVIICIEVLLSKNFKHKLAFNKCNVRSDHSVLKFEA